MKRTSILFAVAILAAAGLSGVLLAAERPVPADQVLDRVDEATLRGLAALDKLLALAPEQAHSAIQEAMTLVTRGHDEAVSRLQSVPQPPSPPDLPSPPETPEPDRATPPANPPEVPGDQTGEAPVDGVARAIEAFQAGTTKALETLEGLRLDPDLPQQALKGLGRAIQAIEAGRDRALDALENAAARGLVPRPDRPDTPLERMELPAIPELPMLPELPALPERVEVPERPERP